MKLEIKAILRVAVSLFCMAGSASSANIVVNGNFDGTTYAGPNGDVAPNGWTVGPPSYIIQSVMNVESTVNVATDQGPQSGLDYIAFQSPALYGRDCLYQDLSTVAGQTYDISFWVAITATAPPNNVVVTTHQSAGVTPEPFSLVLAGSGLLLVGLIRRRG